MFLLVAEAHGLIYPRPLGDNFSFASCSLSHMWRRPLTQRMPKQKIKQPKCANCKRPHVVNYKGCPAYKDNRYSINMWWTTKKSYASILRQNSAPLLEPKGDTFSFTADQLVIFVATVAIQIAQPQLCYLNAPKAAVDKQSSLCQRVSKAAKSQLGNQYLWKYLV